MTYFVPHIIKRIPSADIQSIQTGEATISGGSTFGTASITAIVLAKSFLVFQFEDENTTSNNQQIQMTGKFNSTTQIEFRRKSSGSLATIRWWVVEFTSTSSANVQHISHSRVSSTVDNVSITSVDLAHSFPLMTMRSFNSGTPNEDNMAVADLTTSTNLQLRYESTVGMDLEIQVIENPNWDVSRYTDTISTGDTDEDTTISAVTLDETWLVPYGKPASGASGGLDAGQNLRFNLTSTTNIKASAEFTKTFDIDLVYFVIESNGKFKVQALDDNIPDTSSSGTTAVSPNIDTAKSVIFMKSMINSYCNNSNGANSDGDDMRIKHTINSVSQIGQERVSNSNNAKFTMDVIDFSASF